MVKAFSNAEERLFRANTEIWAHRGARSTAPENTIAAGKAALEQGAYGWEVDIRLTRDGLCVLLHDMGLLRTTDSPRRLKGDLPPLVKNTDKEFLKRLSAGSWFARRDPFGTIAEGLVPMDVLASYQSEPVPTLREALSFTRLNGWRINVEIKDSREAGALMVQEVCGEVRAQGMEMSVIVSSFCGRYLSRVREICPSIETALLVRRVPSNVMELLMELGAGGIHIHQDFIDPGTVDMLHREGIAVRVYTVNRPAVMERLVRLGVDGIITDFPLVLKEAAKAVSGTLLS